MQVVKAGYVFLLMQGVKAGYVFADADCESRIHFFFWMEREKPDAVV